MEQLISVIIPVYNVERYLARCLDSVLRQTYSNIEVIVVNDGSTDKSGVICDDYQQADKRVIVIHQENGGVSSARNKGLDIAKGDYIYFCDPDDYLENNILYELWASMQNNRTDIAICKYDANIYVNDELRKTEIKGQGFPEDVMSVPTMLVEFHKNTLLFMVWNKLFRHSIICEHFIRFPDLKRLEDASFVYVYLKYVKSISIVSSTLYHYSIFRDGTRTATTKFNAQLYTNYYKCYLRGKELVDVLSLNCSNNCEDLNLLKERMEAHFFTCLCGDIVLNLSFSGQRYGYRKKYIQDRINDWKRTGIKEKESWFKGITNKLLFKLVKYKLVNLLVAISFLYSFKHLE